MKTASTPPPLPLLPSPHELSLVLKEQPRAVKLCSWPVKFHIGFSHTSPTPMSMPSLRLRCTFFFFFSLLPLPLFVVPYYYYYSLALASHKSARMCSCACARATRIAPAFIARAKEGREGAGGRIKGQIFEYSNSCRVPLLPHTTPRYASVTLHYTIEHYTTLCHITLHYIALHCATLRYTTLYYTMLHYLILLYTTSHYTTL